MRLTVGVLEDLMIIPREIMQSWGLWLPRIPRRMCLSEVCGCLWGGVRGMHV